MQPIRWAWRDARSIGSRVCIRGATALTKRIRYGMTAGNDDNKSFVGAWNRSSWKMRADGGWTQCAHGRREWCLGERKFGRFFSDFSESVTFQWVHTHTRARARVRAGFNFFLFWWESVYRARLLQTAIRFLRGITLLRGYEMAISLDWLKGYEKHLSKLSGDQSRRTKWKIMRLLSYNVTD